jgi:hypothetical protein
LCKESYERKEEGQASRSSLQDKPPGQASRTSLQAKPPRKASKTSLQDKLSVQLYKNDSGNISFKILFINWFIN